MALTVLILFGGLLLLLFFNFPLMAAIGIPTAAVMLLNGLNVSVFAQRLFTATDSFTLLAIPFFMLAGKIMELGGMSKRIVRLANSLVGWITGGLGHVMIAACAFFGALTGSAPATTAAIGSVLIPDMKEHGYPSDFCAGLAAVSGTLGIIIPPSIPLIVYGVATGTPVGTLFIGGIMPGLFLSAALMVMTYFQAKKREITQVTTFTGREVWNAFTNSILAILVPVIILGGIYGGIFTPTEAGAVACVYGFIVAFFIYKEISIKDLKEILGGAISSTVMVLSLIAVSGAFSWVLTVQGISTAVGAFIELIAVNKYLFLLLVNLLLLFMGCFFETTAAILIAVPILFPIAADFGINPVHFGLIVCINLGFGMATPPIGENQYIAAAIAKVPIEKEIKAALPFLLTAFLGLAIITYVPQLVLWLPTVLGT